VCHLFFSHFPEFELVLFSYCFEYKSTSLFLAVVLSVDILLYLDAKANNIDINRSVSYQGILFYMYV